MTLPTPLLFFIFAATAGTAARSCNQPQQTTATAAQTAPAKTPAKGPQVTAVQMSRGACFGKCPVYSIELQNNGLVRYSGRRFVEKEGVYEKTLDKAAINALLSEFTQARVDTMQDSYERLISDLPSIEYVVTFANGKNKTIQNAHYGPQMLPALARRIDALIQAPDYSWKRTATQAAE